MLKASLSGLDRIFRARSKSAPGIPSQDASTPNPAPKKKKKSARKKLYDLHTWVGFHIAVIMFVVLLTGTLATISNELDWLTRSQMRVVPDGSQVSMQEMVEAVQADRPGLTLVSLSEFEGDHFAYRGSIINEHGAAGYVHVNQWTGEVTGYMHRFTFQYFFRNLHRYLFLPKIFGLTIVSAMAVFLAISLYTGLKTSRNWRTLMTRVRFSKGTRIAVGDAHKAAGLWSIWFFVLMIVTGIWYFAEYIAADFVDRDFEPAFPVMEVERLERMGDIITEHSAVEMIDRAQSAYPELRAETVNFLYTSRFYPSVAGDAGNPIVRQRANQVYFDPSSLEVAEIKRSRDMSTVTWLNQIADPLHFGSFGGLPVKLIWFVFGVFMTGLSATGVWLTWKRLKSRGISKMQIATTPVIMASLVFGSLAYTGLQIPTSDIQVTPALIWYAGGVILWCIALFAAVVLFLRLRSPSRTPIKNAMISLLVIACVASGVHANLIQDPFALPERLGVGRDSDGPVSASLYLVQSDTGAPTGRLNLVITGIDGRLNLKTGTVRLFNNEDVIGDGRSQNFNLILNTQNMRVGFPLEALNAATHIEAVFETRSGNEYSLIWALDTL